MREPFPVQEAQGKENRFTHWKEFFSDPHPFRQRFGEAALLLVAESTKGLRRKMEEACSASGAQTEQAKAFVRFVFTGLCGARLP